MGLLTLFSVSCSVLDIGFSGRSGPGFRGDVMDDVMRNAENPIPGRQCTIEALPSDPDDHAWDRETNWRSMEGRARRYYLMYRVLVIVALVGPALVAAGILEEPANIR